jgi:hypothetical protein
MSIHWPKWASRFGRFVDNAISFTPHHHHSSASSTDVGGLTSAQIPALTSADVAALSVAQLQAIAPADMALFDVAAMIGFSKA